MLSHFFEQNAFYIMVAKRFCEDTDREMAFKVLGDDLAKRLLGADSALAPRSLLARSYP